MYAWLTVINRWVNSKHAVYYKYFQMVLVLVHALKLIFFRLLREFSNWMWHYPMPFILWFMRELLPVKTEKNHPNIFFHEIKTKYHLLFWRPSKNSMFNKIYARKIYNIRDSWLNLLNDCVFYFQWRGSENQKQRLNGRLIVVHLSHLLNCSLSC